MLDRRTFLALAGLAACTHQDPPLQAVDPDVALTAEALATEDALIATYDRLLEAFPRMAPAWGPLRADHLAHRERLAPGAAPAPSPTEPTVLLTPLLARRALLTATRQAARSHAAAVTTASPDLAGVLASLAACESSHAALL